MLSPKIEALKKRDYENELQKIEECELVVNYQKLKSAKYRRYVLRLLSDREAYLKRELYGEPDLSMLRGEE